MKKRILAFALVIFMCLPPTLTPSAAAEEVEPEVAGEQIVSDERNSVVNITSGASINVAFDEEIRTQAENLDSHLTQEQMDFLAPLETALLEYDSDAAKSILASEMFQEMCVYMSEQDSNEYKRDTHGDWGLAYFPQGENGDANFQIYLVTDWTNGQIFLAESYKRDGLVTDGSMMTYDRVDGDISGSSYDVINWTYEHTIISGKCGTDASWTFDSDTGLLNITGSGAMSNGSNLWSFERTDLRQIIIGDSITEIGNNNFASFPNLSKVTIGAGVKKIGAGAFQADYSLKTVAIPDSVEIIGEEAFHFAGIELLTIGSGLSEIGSLAFLCPNIKNPYLHSVSRKAYSM